MASGLIKLLKDLRRRRVFRATGLYIVGAWVVVQVADVVFQAFSIPDTALRFVFLAAFLGYPVVMFFAWHYEFSEDGISRTNPLDESNADNAAIPLSTRDYLIISALMTILVLITLGTFSRVAEIPVPTLSGSAPPNSVAVLPFENASDDANNAYFSDGVAEEIVNRLTQLDELVVPGRRTSFRYRDSNLELAEIARELDVRYLIEGSVRKHDQQVRISAQLVSAELGYEIWTQTYDRRLDHIFQVQDEIANQISGELAGVLGIETPAAIATVAPTEKIDAYDLYLQGQEKLYLRDEKSLLESIDYYEQALELDPGFARARAALATAHALLPEYSDADQHEHHAIAAEHAMQASRDDPALAGPQAILAYMHTRNWRWLDGEPRFSNALALDDRDATVHQWYSNFLNDVFYRERALGHAQTALALESAAPAVNVVAAFNYLFEGSKANELVIRFSDAAKDRGYAGTLGERMKYIVALRDGRTEQAVSSLESVYRSRDRDDTAWIRPYAKAYGNPTLVPAAIAALRTAAAEASMSDGTLFMFYAALGAADPFFDLAVKHIDDKRLPHVWTLLPEAAPIRRDARFAGLVEAIGLVEFWDANGWPDLCRRDNDAIVCQ